MILVVATIHLNAGQRAAFLAELSAIVDLVRAEEGCLEYAPAVEVESRIPVQAAPRADAVTIVEKWTSVEALARHLSAPHMTAYRERVRDCVQWVDLRILEPV